MRSAPEQEKGKQGCSTGERDWALHLRFLLPLLATGIHCGSASPLQGASTLQKVCRFTLRIPPRGHRLEHGLSNLRVEVTRDESRDDANVEITAYISTACLKLPLQLARKRSAFTPAPHALTR